MNPVLIDLKAVCSITGLTRSRVYELMNVAEGNFPQPTKIGRSNRWHFGDVVAWAEGLKDPSARPQPVVAPRVARVRATPTETTVRTGQVGRLGSDAKYHLVEPRQRSRQVPATWKPNVTLYIKRPRQPLEVFGGGGLKPAEPKRLRWFRPNQLEMEQQTAPAACEQTGPRADVRRPHQTNLPTARSDGTVLRQQYEEGATADELAECHGMGKSKVLRLLREAGTEIRKSGRRTTKSHRWPKL